MFTIALMIFALIMSIKMTYKCFQYLFMFRLKKYVPPVAISNSAK